MTNENIHIALLLQKIEGQKNAAEEAELTNQLIAAINHLIIHDFDQLIQLLYRIDIDEKKLKKLLAENTQTDAAVIIAQLIIKRQQEKQQTKTQFKKDTDIADEDKW